MSNVDPKHFYVTLLSNTSKVAGDTTGLIYCDLISPQYVGRALVRCMRTFVYSSLSGQHVFDNFYYLPVEKRTFKSIRIEILQLTGKPFEFKSSTTPSNLVLHFWRVSTWYNKNSFIIILAVHFMLMDPLVRYYLHQAGHEAGLRGKHDGIGPIYAAPPFL